MMITISGCSTSMQYNYIAKDSSVSKPAIESINKVFVGESLLTQGRITQHDAIYLSSEIVFGTFNTHTATRGFYLKSGESNGKEFYLPYNNSDSGKFIRSAIANGFNGLMALSGEKTLCALTSDLEFCKPNSPFERLQKEISTTDSFQQTLIYSGKVGNKINIGYREFSGNLARPAFNNEVEYDLSESKIIGYKGAKLEIIEATNEYIKYKVLRNFN